MRSVWQISKLTEKRDVDAPAFVRERRDYGCINTVETEEEALKYLSGLAERAKKKGWRCSLDKTTLALSVHYCDSDYVVMYFSAERVVGYGKIPFKTKSL